MTTPAGKEGTRMHADRPDLCGYGKICVDPQNPWKSAFHFPPVDRDALLK